ncbi:MAG: septum formation inhibitor Maf [Calditrichaeota bacterium]|nr:MAG: septum formation inhibitor Maf [Calditrichota bacterium]
MTTNLTKLGSQFEIILGSRSPRRVKLLSESGIKFKQLIPDIDEKTLEGEKPIDYAVRLAQEKALALLPQLYEQQLVIGCDTIVVLEGAVLGKPEDEADAFRILSTLSGKQHEVCTALAIANNQNVIVTGHEITQVYFNAVSADEIRNYISSGEPMDKAGAYGIQGMGAFLVDRIEGNLDTVIGFPRTLLDELARQILES